MPPEWPEHFPANCPLPSDADTDGDMFHLVNDSDRDFKSSFDKKERKNAPPCLRVALSCYRTLKDIQEHRKAFAAIFRDHKIACATLSPIHGKIRATGSKGHHSLWLRTVHLAACHSMFAIVDE